jgi:hypothetical protein
VIELDAYAVIRLKTEKDELIFADPNSARKPRSHALRERIDLSPEERLALFRLIVEVQNRGCSSVQWTVRELARQCDATATTIGSLISKLVSSELLDADRVRPMSHGGKAQLVLTNNLLYLLQQSSWTAESLIRKLQRKILLPDNGYNPEKIKRGGFSRSNRWLLSVLLDHSDSMGVVDSLRGSELRALTGFSKERLRTQLEHLKCLGFLHARVPGGLSIDILSRRPAVYYLNLHHPYFGEDRPSGLTILLRYGEINEDNSLSDIDQLLYLQKEVFSKSRKPVAKLKSVRGLNIFSLRLSHSNGINPAMHYVESLVCRLTSLFLSNNWDCIHKYNDDAFKLIETMIVEENGSEATKKKFFDAKSILFGLAQQRAIEIFTLLKEHSQMEPSELQKYDYLLLPVGYSPGKPRLHFVLEAFHKQKNKSGFKCLMITCGLESKLDQTNELSAEQRHSFGFINEKMRQKVIALKMPVFDGRATAPP